MILVLTMPGGDCPLTGRFLGILILQVHSKIYGHTGSPRFKTVLELVSLTQLKDVVEGATSKESEEK
jgi:hypothetical protein